MKPDLIIVIPVYNEESHIVAVLEEWTGMLQAENISHEFYVVDDGSRDDTPARLLEAQARMPNVKVFSKSNSGHGRSCRFGYEKAVEAGCEWVFQIDSDGQCDPVYFPSFWKLRDTADCMFGYRWTRGDGLSRILISRTCQLAVFLMTGCNPHDANVPYRLMRNSVLAPALQKIPRDFDLHNIALSVVLHKNRPRRFAYLPIHFRPRQGGESSLNLRKIASLGLTMLKSLPGLIRSLTLGKK